MMRIDINLLKDIEENVDGRLNILKSMRKLRIPTCLIHGSADESVHVTEAHDLSKAARRKSVQLHLIPDATHTYGSIHPFDGAPSELKEAVKTTSLFFQQHLIQPFKL